MCVVHSAILVLLPKEAVKGNYEYTFFKHRLQNVQNHQWDKMVLLILFQV